MAKPATPKAEVVDEPRPVQTEATVFFSMNAKGKTKETAALMRRKGICTTFLVTASHDDYAVMLPGDALLGDVVEIVSYNGYALTVFSPGSFVGGSHSDGHLVSAGWGGVFRNIDAAGVWAAFRGAM